MVVFVAMLRLLFCLYLSNTLLSEWFTSPSRKSVLSSTVNDVFSSINMSGMVGFTMSSLLLSIALSNLLGSVPGIFNSNMYYFFRAGLSISL